MATDLSYELQLSQGLVLQSQMQETLQKQPISKFFSNLLLIKTNLIKFPPPIVSFSVG